MGFFSRKSKEKKEKKTKVPADDEVECPNCGTLINETAVMCYACGARTK